VADKFVLSLQIPMTYIAAHAKKVSRFDIPLLRFDSNCFTALSSLDSFSIMKYIASICIVE